MSPFKLALLLLCSVQSKKSPRAKSTFPNDLNDHFQPTLLGYAFFYLNPSCPVSTQPSIGNGTCYYYYWPTFTEHLLCAMAYKVILFVTVQDHHRKRMQQVATALKQAGPDTRIRTKFQVYIALALIQIWF